ncbi:MAG: magnesium transporter [Planctomycetaceae bacterium]|nr:magnesium transporter [Planctomycetaceae bacterium]
MKVPKPDHYDEPVLQHARTDFVRVLNTQTVGGALEQVRATRPTGRIVYFYVVDSEGVLKGVLPTRRLLLSPPETSVTEIMVKEVVSLPDSATLLDACEYFILHRLLAAPVVDADGRIVGVVDVELYTDEMTELARRDESEDVFQMIGVRLAQVQQAGLPVVFGRRFPWLMCNILGGIACAFLAGRFEGVLQRAVALSLFIPVVLAIAESVSIQTLSLALQAHPGNRFRWRETLAALAREIPVGAMLGAAAGSLIAVTALVWLREGTVALTLLLAILLAVTTAAALGLAIPTLLLAARRDPKLASGPIVLTLTDLCTLSYYLGLATWLL